MASTVCMWLFGGVISTKTASHPGEACTVGRYKYAQVQLHLKKKKGCIGKIFKLLSQLELCSWRCNTRLPSQEQPSYRETVTDTCRFCPHEHGRQLVIDWRSSFLFERLPISTRMISYPAHDPLCGVRQIIQTRRASAEEHMFSPCAYKNRILMRGKGVRP